MHHRKPVWIDEKAAVEVPLPPLSIEDCFPLPNESLLNGPWLPGAVRMDQMLLRKPRMRAVTNRCNTCQAQNAKERDGSQWRDA
jgi:hypothetical protein